MADCDIPTEPEFCDTSTQNMKEDPEPPSIPTESRENGTIIHNPCNKDQKFMYGQLTILGYSDRFPIEEDKRKKSSFVLWKKPIPNGVKKSRRYLVRQPHSTRAFSDATRHSVTYQMSRTRSVVIEYTPDKESDMFQAGRSDQNPIDFVVIETFGNNTDETGITQSTVSRYAFRIIVNRGSNTAQIYAAGFDTSGNIFLGENAIKWRHDGETDGFTTNGVLIMHPPGKFGESSQPGEWREVSVGGNIYKLSESRSDPIKRIQIEGETNILVDGTLIDLCCCTLLWRSAEGISNAPTRQKLEEMVDELNARRPKCPVGLNTLEIPLKSTSVSTASKQPYVYLACGHVQGHHEWGQLTDSERFTCPMCLRPSSTAKLRMGTEPSFYVDSGPLDHAFNPCGHMASEKTVKYWAFVTVPYERNVFQPACPFCLSPLKGDPGYVRLIFQDDID